MSASSLFHNDLAATFPSNTVTGRVACMQPVQRLVLQSTCYPHCCLVWQFGVFWDRPWEPECDSSRSMAGDPSDATLRSEAGIGVGMYTLRLGWGGS